MRVLVLAVMLVIAGLASAQQAEPVESPATDPAPAAEPAEKVAEPTDAAEPAPEEPAVEAYKEANEIVLFLCMECHGDEGHEDGLLLPVPRSGQGLVDVPSSQRDDLMLIDLENPEKSYLLMKLKDDPGIQGQQMPIARKLTDEQIGYFELWVAELAAEHAAESAQEDTETDGDDAGAEPAENAAEPGTAPGGAEGTDEGGAESGK